MKKIFTILMVFVLCTGVMVVPAFAAGGSMSVSSATAEPGQTVSVDVTITGNPGVAGLVVVPSYDKNALTLDSITGSGLEWTTGAAASWSDAVDTTYTGRILTLNFTVNSDAAKGTYPVSVSVDASNFNEELISFAVSDGSVTVGDNESADQTRGDNFVGVAMVAGVAILAIGAVVFAKRKARD